MLFPQFLKVVGRCTRWVALGAVLGAVGCVSKPIQIHTIDAANGAPIADVDVRQHGARFFRFMPKKGKAPKTNADGRIDLVLDAKGTNLALLRTGYVPTQVVIVPEPQGRANPAKPTATEVDISPANYVEFESLADGAVITVRLSAIVDEPVRVCVRNDQGVLLADAEVVLESALFLLKDGSESEWGLPPMQRAVTDRTGCVTMTAYRGLRNFLYVRMLGCETQRISLERAAERSTVQVVLRKVESKPTIIRVIDMKTGVPIKGADVEIGKKFDGIARDPNGWSVKTDANGCTPVVLVQNIQDLVVTASSEKYLMKRTLMNWSLASVTKPFEIELHPK